MILVSSVEGGIRERSCHSSPDACTGTRWSFLIMPVVSKNGFLSSTTLSCPSAHIVWSTKLMILRGMVNFGSLYVEYCDLRNESQGESRKRVAGKSLPDNFIKILSKGAEKSGPKQKPSEPKTKKKQ